MAIGGDGVLTLIDAVLWYVADEPIFPKTIVMSEGRDGCTSHVAMKQGSTWWFPLLPDKPVLCEYSTGSNKVPERWRANALRTAVYY